MVFFGKAKPVNAVIVLFSKAGYIPALVIKLEPVGG